MGEQVRPGPGSRCDIEPDDRIGRRGDGLLRSTEHRRRARDTGNQYLFHHSLHGGVRRTAPLVSRTWMAAHAPSRGASRPVILLARHSALRCPRISTAMKTSRYVTPGWTGSGRFRRSRTLTESRTPPQSRTWMRGCDANRTSRALADARRMIAGACDGAALDDRGARAESRATESRGAPTAGCCARQLNESGNETTTGPGSCAPPRDVEASVTRAHRNDQRRLISKFRNVNIRAHRGTGLRFCVR